MVSAASATTTDPGQRSHLRPILRLGGPLVINNLAYAGITFADTVMAGHISADALAAVAVGSNALQLQSLIGAGMMMALAPLVAHDYGAGRDTAAGGYMRQAFWIALAMSILPVVVALFAGRIYTAVGTAAPIIPTATAYTQAICCGVPAMFALERPDLYERRTRPHAHDHADDGHGRWG